MRNFEGKKVPGGAIVDVSTYNSGILARLSRAFSSARILNSECLDVKRIQQLAVHGASETVGQGSGFPGYDRSTRSRGCHLGGIPLEAVNLVKFCVIMAL